MTKQFSNYSDLLTFTRASKGHALRPVSYGSEEVTNGAFDSDTTGWAAARCTAAVSSGQVVLTSTDTNPVFTQTLNLTIGKLYRVEGDIIGSTGTAVPQINMFDSGFSSYDDLSASGSFSFIPTTATNYLQLRVQGTTVGDTATFDNISVKEVTFDESDGTLTLFEHPDNIPRVEWDADRNRLGLLVEEQRTNLFTTSDAEDWTVTGSGTSTINTEFTLGAFTGVIKASGGADWNRVRTNYISVTSGTTYCLTVFYKYGTSNNVLLNFRNADSATESRVVGASGSLSISLANAGTLTILEETSLPNDVKKVVVKYVPNFSGNFEFGVGPNSTTSGETVIPLAAQIEQASFGTSYIKTTGATATRSADVASIDTAEFGYNSAEGTVVCEFNIKYDDGGSGFPRVWEIGNSSSSADRINVYIGEQYGTLSFGINTNTASVAGGNLKVGTGGSVQSTVAMGWAKDNVGVSDDGDSALTDSDADILPTAFSRNRLKIGGAANTASDNISGHIKSIKYYPRKLTNAQLEDLSS